MTYPSSTLARNGRSLGLPDLASVDVSRLRSIRLLGLAVIGLAGLVVLLLVRTTGGTLNQLNYLGYLPVLLGAYIFGLPGGLLSALYVGVLLGPVAPALGLPGSHESIEAYALRGAILLIAGATTGVLFDRVRSNLVDLRSVTIEVVDRQRDGMVALARGAEAKDTDTGDHVVRIQEIATELALATGLASETAAGIGWSAMLHDIGKIHVPDRICSSRARSTTPSGNHATSPRVGRRVLAQGAGFEVARRIARSHHENFDGSGYPDGLAGDAIPRKPGSCGWRIPSMPSRTAGRTRPLGPSTGPSRRSIVKPGRNSIRTWHGSSSTCCRATRHCGLASNGRASRTAGRAPVPLVPGPFGHIQDEASR